MPVLDLDLDFATLLQLLKNTWYFVACLRRTYSYCFFAPVKVRLNNTIIFDRAILSFPRLLVAFRLFSILSIPFPFLFFSLFFLLSFLQFSLYLLFEIFFYFFVNFNTVFWTLTEFWTNIHEYVCRNNFRGRHRFPLSKYIL